MFKILHIPSATYVRYYPSRTSHELIDITFISEKEAKKYLLTHSCTKSNFGDYCLMHSGPLPIEAMINLKSCNRYVLPEHLIPVEV